MRTRPWPSALGAAGSQGVTGPCQAPRGHQLSTAPTQPDSGSSEPRAGLASHGQAALNSCLLLAPGASSWESPPAGLTAGGARGQDGGWRLLSLCQEQKRKTTLFMEKAEKASPLLLASGLPGGTEALCWENRKQGFPGPVGPPADRLPQLPLILSSSASHQLPVCPSICPYVPLTPGPRLPALEGSFCQC